MLESAACLVHNYVLRQIYSITLYCMLSAIAIFWQKCWKKFKQFPLLQYHINCTKIWQPQWIKIHCKEASCTKPPWRMIQVTTPFPRKQSFQANHMHKVLCSFSEHSIIARTAVSFHKQKNADVHIPNSLLRSMPGMSPALPKFLLHDPLLPRIK